MNHLRPIKLLPVRERVASVLREAILLKEIKAGSIITLESIAKQLGVSSTPVREAFQTLARDGLIKLTPNKGAKVLLITPKFIQNHYETRAVLECAATAAVCSNGADTTEIENAYYQGKELILNNDFEAYGNLNQAFHMAIWAATGNEKMRQILAEMWNGLSLAENVTQREYVQISCSEHYEILQSILKRDEQQASQLMYAHIIRSMHSMLTRFT